MNQKSVEDVRQPSTWYFSFERFISPWKEGKPSLKKTLLWAADFPGAHGHAGRLNDTSELSHRSKMLPFMLAPSVTWFGCCEVGVGAIENSVASEKRSRGHGSDYNLEHHLVRYMANVLRSVGGAAQDPARCPLPLEMPAAQGEQCFQGFVQSVIPLSGATWYKCFRKNWSWSWTELQGPSRQGKPMVFSMRAMQSDGDQVLDMLLTNSATACKLLNCSKPPLPLP